MVNNDGKHTGVSAIVDLRRTRIHSCPCKALKHVSSWVFKSSIILSMHTNAQYSVRIPLISGKKPPYESITINVKLAQYKSQLKSLDLKASTLPVAVAQCWIYNFFSYFARKLTLAEKVPTCYFSLSTWEKIANQNIFFGDHLRAYTSLNAQWHPHFSDVQSPKNTVDNVNGKIFPTCNDPFFKIR